MCRLDHLERVVGTVFCTTEDADDVRKIIAHTRRQLVRGALYP